VSKEGRSTGRIRRGLQTVKIRSPPRNLSPARFSSAGRAHYNCRGCSGTLGDAFGRRFRRGREIRAERVWGGLRSVEMIGSAGY
jgi:hypothetical protein